MPRVDIEIQDNVHQVYILFAEDEGEGNPVDAGRTTHIHQTVQSKLRSQRAKEWAGIVAARGSKVIAKVVFSTPNEEKARQYLAQLRGEYAVNGKVLFSA